MKIKQNVCNKFFLDTLCISHGPVMSAIKNRNEHGLFHGEDKRGKSVSHSTTPNVYLEAIREHIKKLPTMKSHYTRKRSTRLYLDPKLSIMKM